ncbi:MAG: outer membrane beta-barrel protein [candidate division Zixibacteria bacterium]|nr:outer membrane beta-barrel protein [candidate division Zixibacteria bacterium]
MKKSGLSFVVILLLLFAVSAVAQTNEEEKNAKWRNFEVTVLGGMAIPTSSLKNWNDSLGAKTGLNFGGYGGYYLNDRVSIGTYFTYSQYSMKLYRLHYKLYDIGTYLKYDFVGKSSFEPYIRISAGGVFAKFATWVDSTGKRLREVSFRPGLSLGATAGLLYYTFDFGGLFIEGTYHHAFLENSKGTHAGIDYDFKKNLDYIDIRAGITGVGRSKIFGYFYHLWKPNYYWWTMKPVSAKCWRVSLTKMVLS